MSCQESTVYRARDTIAECARARDAQLLYHSRGPRRMWRLELQDASCIVWSDAVLERGDRRE